MGEFLSRVRAVDLHTVLGRSSHALVEILYPKTCAGCDARGHWLCSYCEASQGGIGGQRCQRCGVERMVGASCWCGNMPESIAVARSAYEFRGWPRMMVHRTKYGGERARVAWMAEHMVPLVADFGTVDGLVPVPLHRTKLHQRGFNQSEDLARAISDATGLPILSMLARTKMTAPQVTLSQADRAKNVSGAFALHTVWVPEQGNRYLLIDDVRTSGATLGACADVLRQTPGVRVGALTFAVAR